MTRSRKGTITCPSCGEKYSTEVIYSTIWSGDVSTDLLRYTMGKMPINFMVHTCPECGWSGKGEFPEPEPEKIRLFIRERITPALDGNPVPPWKRWEFYAWIREAAGAADVELGETCLIASHCARLGQQPEEEERLRRESIGHFTKAIEKENVPEDSLYRTVYLLGELYRRSGDSFDAKAWFEKVLKLKYKHPTRGFFQNLARRQMEEPRDMVGEKPKEEKEIVKGCTRPGILSRLIPWRKGN